MQTIHHYIRPTSCKVRIALAALLLTLCAGPAAGADAPALIEWRADLATTEVRNLYLRHGESADLTARLYLRGRAYEPTNAIAFYQTNGMAQAWWSAPCSISSNTVSVAWTPALDPGADLVALLIRLDDSAYRAGAMLYLRPSPGADPNILPPPTQWIDFDRISWTNAPWALSADVVIQERTPTGWTYEPADGSIRLEWIDGSIDPSVRGWWPVSPAGAYIGWAPASTDEDATEIAFYDEAVGPVVATRSLTAGGYILGSQSDKPFAPWVDLVAAAAAATNYTDAAVAAAEPGNYAAVSNAAMHALQSYVETDPFFWRWASTNRVALDITTAQNAAIGYASRAAEGARDLAVQRAKEYTDAAVAAAEPANYAAVSNAAMHALQSYTETDPSIAWSDIYDGEELRHLLVRGEPLTASGIPLGPGVDYLSGNETVASTLDLLSMAFDGHTHTAAEIGAATPAAVAATALAGTNYTDAAVAAASSALSAAIPLVYYGTSESSAGSQDKVVVCASWPGNVAGAILYVRFANNYTYNGQAYLVVNGATRLPVYRNGTTAAARYQWLSGETVGFVCTGTGFEMIDGAFATTTYYGVTKLSSATNSTSAAMAATPAAVKLVRDQIGAESSAREAAVASATNALSALKADARKTVGGVNFPVVYENALLDYATADALAAAALAGTNYTDAAVAAAGGGADMTSVSNTVTDLLTVAVAEAPTESTLEVLRLAVADLWEIHDKLAAIEAYDDIVDAIDSLVAASVAASLTNYATRAQLAGYVPTSRTINGRALSSNISLTATNDGALPAAGYSTVSPADIGSDPYIYVEFSGSTRILSYAGSGTLDVGGLYAPNGPPCHLVLSGFSSVNWPSSWYPIVDGTYDPSKINYYDVGGANGDTYVRFLFSR